MPDRERVIKSIANCPRLPFDLCFGECQDCDCPYYGEAGIEKLHHDALALLKEQEAVEPEVEVLNEIDRLYRCPKCHKCFFYEKQKYCDQCGQAVKWK